MRLYLNRKEVPVIKSALQCSLSDISNEACEIIERVIERIELCEMLQDNQRKAGEDE